MAAKRTAKQAASDKKNLAKGTKITAETAREMGKKGAVKSNEVRRRRKSMSEDIKALLSMPMDAGVLDNIEELRGLKEIKTKNVTAQELMLYQLIVKAIKTGNYKAIELIYEMTGDSKAQADDNDAVLQFIRGMIDND